MFITVLFIIAKMWKQPQCSPIDEWIKQLLDIYTVEFYSALKKKKENFTHCNSMDGPGEYYTKSNKPVRKTNTI